MTELVVRLVFSLAVVVGLLMLIAKFAGRRLRSGSDPLVQVVHRQSISRNAAVSVVNVGGRVLVLGTTDNEVRLLTELDPEAMQPAGELVLPDAVEVLELFDAVEAIEIVADTPADPSPTPVVASVETPVFATVPAEPTPYVGRRKALPVGAVAPTEVAPPVEPVVLAVPVVPDVPVVLDVPVVPDVPAAPKSHSLPAAIQSAPAGSTSYVGRRVARTGGLVVDPGSRLPAVPVSGAEPAPAPAVISPAALLLATEIARAARSEAQAASNASASPSPAASASPPLSRQAAARRERAARYAGRDGALTGSVLSPQTWRQAWASVTGHAS